MRRIASHAIPTRLRAMTMRALLRMKTPGPCHLPHPPDSVVSHTHGLLMPLAPRLLTLDIGGKQSRRDPEPASDVLSQRSFVEESNLYGGADFQTPRPPTRPRQSPTRQSSRIASRDSVASDDGSLPSPSRGPRIPSVPQTDPSSENLQPESDPVQPEDDGARVVDSTAGGGRPPERPNRPNPVQDDSSIPQQPPSRPDRPNRPNPVQDARNGDLVLPRPDRNNPQPRNGNATGNDIAANPNGALGQFIRRGPFIAPRGGGVQPVALVRDGGGPSSSGGSSDGSSDGSSNDGTDDHDPQGLCNILAHGFRRFSRRFPRWLRKAFQVFGMLVLVCWLWLILLQVFMPLDRWEGVRSSNLYPLQDWQSHWRLNIAQLVPYVVLHPFAVLTGTLDYADFRNTLRWAQINAEHNKVRLDHQAQTVGQMRRLLPELIAIKMEPVTKEWSVADNFWHALNEQVKHGSLMYSLLSLEKSEDGTYTISDPHWEAVRQRIQSEGTLLSDRPATVGDGSLTMSDEVLAHVDQSLSQAWENWLKENEDAMKRARAKDEERPDETPPNPHYQDLYGNVETAVARRLKDLGLEEQIITREEFITEIRHQSDQYAAQIRSEMDAIQDRLGRALEIAEDAKTAAETPPGMSRAEVKKIIEEVVQRSIADAQLEAIAKGNIKSHLDTDLIHRKNYFSTIRGAIIDPVLTSGDYDFKTKATAGQETRSRWPWQSTDVVFRMGGKESGVKFPKAMALERWEQDGECWCAGLTDDQNISGVADLSVLTAATVVPQHLVVEHIASGASFDPGSMPKDLEVWIQAPNDKRRRSLEHWSSQRWPDAKRGDARRLVGQGLVKVGQFQYDNSVAKGESQIFRLSEELLGLDAQTRHVVIRAKTNYGSEDHTCFYRLRLFGEEGRGQDEGALE